MTWFSWYPVCAAPFRHLGCVKNETQGPDLVMLGCFNSTCINIYVHTLSYTYWYTIYFFGAPITWPIARFICSPLKPAYAKRVHKPSCLWATIVFFLCGQDGHWFWEIPWGDSHWSILIMHFKYLEMVSFSFSESNAPWWTHFFPFMRCVILESSQTCWVHDSKAGGTGKHDSTRIRCQWST